MFFDTHAHLDDEQLWPIADQVITRARENGVSYLLSVATDRVSSERCLALAVRHQRVYASVGIHPNSAHQASDSDWQAVRKMATHPRAMALGETGLDGYWDHCPFDLQEEFFRRHIELSRTSGLPFIVHMRDCAEPMQQMLAREAEAGPLRGVMHSFTGDWPLAECCLQWGLHISFAGMVTYKKSAALQQVARQIPDDRLLLETDAPYLSPHPQRGHRPNEPALLRHTASCLAEVRGVTLEHLAKLTTRNAMGLFGIAADPDDRLE